MENCTQPQFSLTVAFAIWPEEDVLSWVDRILKETLGLQSLRKHTTSFIARFINSTLHLGESPLCKENDMPSIKSSIIFCYLTAIWPWKISLPANFKLLSVASYKAFLMFDTSSLPYPRPNMDHTAGAFSQFSKTSATLCDCEDRNH